MGDFNWITPQFLAFASPQHMPVEPISPSSPQYATLPKTTEAVEASDLPRPFKNVLTHFAERRIGLVVRLNSELYSPSHFTAIGISHLDMIFDDGTCPPLLLVKKFIKLAHEMIHQRKKGIAVHCKAGLGRTGCLIGAYLIYRHGFTANEIISFMRFMRPGMVVGPQQHWLHLNQGKFREWWWEDTMKQKLALVLPSTPTKIASHKPRLLSNGQTATPPNGSQQSKRAALSEITHNETTASITMMDDCLPAPTPGQPRKISRSHSSNRPPAPTTHSIRQDAEQPDCETVEVQTHRKSLGQNEDERQEEWQMKMLSRRTSSKSPRSSDKKRAISYTTTTTTTRYSTVDDDTAAGIMSDVENWSHDVHFDDRSTKAKTPGSTKSGNGSGSLGNTKIRESPIRRSAGSRETKAGVRKTSGRVGSVGATAVGRLKA